MRWQSDATQAFLTRKPDLNVAGECGWRRSRLFQTRTNTSQRLDYHTVCCQFQASSTFSPRTSWRHPCASAEHREA